jgi:quercetin dioxygenase-like cupin family protein
MKSLLRLSLLALLPTMLPAQNSSTPAATTPPPLLASAVFDWAKLAVTPTPTGERRNVFDGPTATLDQAHCHITTLNPGTTSGEPRRHLQEEIIIVKTGRVELSLDGRLETAGPGSVFFLASNAVTRLRNAGDTPATYYVIYTRTPLTPKH